MRTACLFLLILSCSLPAWADDGLAGRVFVGYQGWFRAPGDGANAGFHHYTKRGKFEPGACTIDLWPDLTGFDADERFDTLFRHADGRVAQVFSSHQRKTVARHFGWMKAYGIDGAVVQRFATRRRNKKKAGHWDTVLDHCRAGAEAHGRSWSLMYDLSGLRQSETSIVIEDFKKLVAERRIIEDTTYLRHRGRPLVAVWGVGFADGRAYTLQECEALIDFLKSDAGGKCSVMLGVPFYFRELKRDAIKDADLLRVLKKADVVSPWSVGRYGTVEGAINHARQHWAGNEVWAKEAGVDHLPVVFPGFSWQNLKGGDAKLGQIPRLQGRFYWSQFLAAKQAGAKAVYVAMFDEIDEATAIFKCTDDPPVGKSRFLTYDGMPSDHYLWLTQQGRRVLRGPWRRAPRRRVV